VVNCKQQTNKQTNRETEKDVWPRLSDNHPIIDRREERNKSLKKEKKKLQEKQTFK
jgi:hypothetical protein